MPNKNPTRHIRPGFWLGLYAAVLLCVFPTYFLSYPVPEFTAKIAALFGALFFGFGCFSIGKLALARMDKPLTSSGDESGSLVLLTLVQSGVGFGLLGTTVLVVGWIFPGQLTLKLTLITAVLILLSAYTVARGEIPAFPTMRFQFSLMETLALAVSAAGLGAAFLSCFSPITYYDSLVYHLALPNIYNQTGTIGPVPFNLYSCFPANTEMAFLYILNQLPQPEYVINLVCLGVSLLTAIGAGQWAHELGGKRQAVLAWTLWWTMPAVIFLSIGAYVDIALAGYVFLSVRSFYIAYQRKWDLRWVIFSGFFAGLAFSTKYTGAISMITLGSLLLLACICKKNVSLRHLSVFVAGFFLPSLFWLAKNTVFVGNPFFPFLYNLFGGRTGWTHSSAAGYFAQLTEYGTKSNILNELFLAPFRLVSAALSFGGGFDVLGDFGWPLIIFGAPVAFFFNKRNVPIRFLSFYALAHFIFWLFTKPVLRFLIGLLPIAVVLASTAYHQLVADKSRLVRSAAYVFVLPWLLSNFFITFLIADGLQPFSVALGLETRSGYLMRRLAYYPSYLYANTHLNSKDKILLIGEQRTYHLSRAFVTSNLFDISPIARICNEAETIHEVVNFFRANDFTHVITNEGELERLGGLEKFGFSAKGGSVLDTLLATKVQLLFENHRVKLYRLLIY